MSQLDVLCIGSITTDILIKLPQSPDVSLTDDETKLQLGLGAKISTDTSALQAGGGAANTAVGLRKLGLQTAAFGLIGDQGYQDFLRQSLQSQDVSTDYLSIAAGETSSFSVILSSQQGERTVLHHRVSGDEFNQETIAQAPPARALYLGHVCQNGITKGITTWKQAHPETIIAWNPGNTQFKNGLDYYQGFCLGVDYLFINVEEAEAFTGLKSTESKMSDFDQSRFGTKIEGYVPHPPDVIKDIRSIAARFLALGIKNVIITDGKNGCQAVTKDTHFFAPGAQAPSVDTLGAGDAMGIGILGAHLHGKNLYDALIWGSRNSASVITQLGAQPGQLRFEDLEE